MEVKKKLEKKGSVEMSMEMLEQVEKIRSGFQMGSRVGVTALGRSTQWREELERLAAMEVVDRNQTAAILLSPDAFKAILAYLDQIDEEREQMQVEALFKAREHMNDWDSGESLATKAVESLKARQDQIRGLLDGHK